MKTFDAKQFVYDKRLRTYKAILSNLGEKIMPTAFAIREGSPDYRRIEFVFRKSQFYSDAFIEAKPRDEKRPIRAVIAKG